MVTGILNHNNASRIHFGIETSQLAIMQATLMSALAVPDTTGSIYTQRAMYSIQTHRLQPAFNPSRMDTASHVDIRNASMQNAGTHCIVITTATIVVNDSTSAIVIKVMLAKSVISV